MADNMNLTGYPKPMTLDTSKPKVQRATQKRHPVRRSAATAGAAYEGSRRATRSITQRSGDYSGKGMLTMELMAAFVIVGIRVVGDFTGTEDGPVTGNVLHSGQLGPLPIMVGLVILFFVLSLVAAGGGTRAKLAVILGGATVLTLGVKSYRDIELVGQTFGRIGTIKAPAASGTETSAATAGAASSVATSPASATPATGTSGTPDLLTPTTNSLGAAGRAAENFGSNFGKDLAGSFDILSPSTIISSYQNQLGDVADFFEDAANASDDAAVAAGKKTISAVVAAGNKIVSFFGGS